MLVAQVHQVASNFIGKEEIMALASLSGRYIKVIRELCEFSLSGVTVYYYEFKSRADRDAFFTRKQEIHDFVKRGREKCEQLSEEIFETLSTLNLKEGDQIPVKYQEKLNEIDTFFTDIDTIGKNWDRDEALPEFESQALLDECGFKEEWKTPLAPWAINSVNTGVFTNQNFSFGCLYKELKKIFKTDFVDC